MATDYVLAAVAAVAGGRLLARSDSSVPARFWGLAFAALALAATLGGTWHGFAGVLPEGVLARLWRATVLAAGVTSFGLLAGSAFAVTSGALRKTLVSIAAMKLLAYTVWMAKHDDFLYVVADSGSALGAVGLLHLVSVLREADVASRWALAGMAVSLVAAAVQSLRLSPHPLFNHNDLYHLVQTVAVVLFYRAARTFPDRRAPHPGDTPAI